MLKAKNLVVLATILFCFILTQSAQSRPAPDVTNGKSRNGILSTLDPIQELAVHKVGKIELAVANNGTFSVNYTRALLFDAFTGEPIPFSCQYPKGARIEYLYGASFWIGAVVGRDTLVSTGSDGWSRNGDEFYPDEPPFGKMVYRSITDPTKPEYEGAISEQDYIAVYTDTFTQGLDDDYFGRQHVPLNIEVTQRSFSWSYAYAEDFVLFDYQIKNIGTRLLENVYMGVYVDADVCFDCSGTNQGFSDDICGFLHTWKSEYGVCEYEDTVFIAWIADNDGDFMVAYESGFHPAPHVTATRIVRTPSEDLEVSFNWWIGNGNPALDFGPREKANKGVWEEDFRDFGTGGLGTPEGDINKYYSLRNKEFDYDQVFTASKQPNDTLWLYPNQATAAEFSDGYDTRYLLSFGPFNIRPGQTLPISFSYLAGEDFHLSDGNLANLPDQPAEYYANLNFHDLALNSTWASWVYDNPGVDTDDDGFFGKFRVCCAESMMDSIYDVLDTTGTYLYTDTAWTYDACDTFFYEGDGVPDFRGASPPPPPDFWLEPSISKIGVRFNGLRSENTKDVFSRTIDFEGYRVYLGRDDRAASYGLLASYDRENYNKWVFNPDRVGGAGYELRDIPFLIDDLRCLYGDSCGDPNFDPGAFTRSNPYAMPGYPDSLFIFLPQDFNVSELGVTTPIRKIYPDEPFPSTLIADSAQPGELTEDGHFKHFEYYFEIEGLLATVPYHVNVTAFDYGSPESGLASLESSVTLGAKQAYPLASSDEVLANDLEVFVYPNPYRLDGAYRERGFEGRTQADRPPDRTREVNFANVPPKCTISIFTIDGDLVREIHHDMDPDADMASHETWDLITRNTQLVVSGMYYWSVEEPNGDVQIGTLVIIM
ncbi:MAG: hypothetical protein OEV49_08860 [candidate division Zixibacteria bacterium]|nr:hypothetical protein [candidate division Zixibacteria bacterium]MDH3936651.1 hypothetical protein [candidate division Zixibacteria bacterium]MDH4032181.1 hypothetical protein [candidate division Zixibacteria bacterium]